VIHVDNLSKTYRQGRTKIKAVKNASLNISKKEAILITGPSGAGKSTLLHLIGGLDKPSGGDLYFGDVSFYDLSDSERSKLRNEKIGFVFQFYHLLPEFTALENVMLPALMRKGKKKSHHREIREKAASLLDLVGLPDRKSHRPSELSGGESQRVAIARSLINSPEVLLCDEPTGNLDSRIGQEIIDCLWVLKEERNMSIVIVTHDEHMHEGFDKRYKMVDGKIEEIKNGAKSFSEWQACK